MPHIFRKAQLMEHRWLSRLLPSILAAGSLITVLDPARLAVAAECQGTEDDGTIQSIATGKGTTSRILSLTIAMEWDIVGGLASSPVPGIAPYMNRGRIAWGDRDDQGISTSGACLSQVFFKSTFFNQTTIKSIGKAQANARKQSMKMSALPYNGKRQVHTIRTAPLEIGVSDRSKVATVIGSARDIQLPILPDRRSVSQVVVGLLSTVESSSQFGGQPFVELNPFASALQLQDNESLRMNRTSAQALHGGNCASECP